MNKHYSILHISDLHKGENNDFDHLFASLCNDADSYDQDIPKPEFIVVCGDLAEGANGEDAEEKIVKQYQEVESFLDKLVDQTEHFQKINPLTPIEFELERDSEKFGMSLGEMNLWQNTGATVVAILQNEELIVSPGPYATLNQGDTLYFVGASDTGQIVQNFFYGN